MEQSPRAETEPLPILPQTEEGENESDNTIEAVDLSLSTPAPALIQLRQRDIPTYRATILKEQNNTCCICKDHLENETGISLDHQHRTKAEPVGVNGAGLIRGVLCRNCNVFEGKIWNNSKRYGHYDRLPQVLRNMAEYLERENYPYIHPSEAPRPRCVSKRQYNKLAKEYSLSSTSTRPCPPFPGKRKPSKRLLDTFERHGIAPYLKPQKQK